MASTELDILVVGGGGSGYEGTDTGYIGGGGGGGGVKASDKLTPTGSLTGTGTYNAYAATTDEYSQAVTVDTSTDQLNSATVTFLNSGLADTSFTATLNIYAVDANNKPSGSSLASGSHLVNSITAGTTLSVNIPLSSLLSVTSGGTYAFVFGVNSTLIEIVGGNSSGQNTYYSTDGTTWTAVNGPIGISLDGYKKYFYDAGSYTVTVGLGGTTADNTGGSSAFDTISVTGGGLGGGVVSGGSYPVNGEAGGSGGGGTYYSGEVGVGGAGTAYEGNAGSTSISNAGGNGGGASEAGYTDSGTPLSGYGGEGYTSAISGTSQVYGSGGGGGYTNTTGLQGIPGGTNAGSGAGGAVGTGYPQVPATTPVANMGGGGGGRVASAAQSSGADGVVIVRYVTGSFGTDSTGGTITHYFLAGVNYTVHTFTTSGTLTLTSNTGSFLMFMP